MTGGRKLRDINVVSETQELIDAMSTKKSRTDQFGTTVPSLDH